MPGSRGLCPVCRKTLLSRYNHDPLCGPCTRAAMTAPPLEAFGPPTWVWDSALWREALARADLPVALAVFRGASGLSQHALAEIVGWSQSTLSLFERGQRDTLWDIRVWLHIADAVDMPRVALLPLVLGRADAALPDGWPSDVTLAGDPLADVGVLEDAGVDVDRRGFGGLAAGAVAGVAFPEISVPARVTAAQVRYLRTCADSLRSRSLAVGGAGLLRQGMRQWRRARRMLDESSYTEVIGRDLVGVTADLAGCTGWLASDGGNPRLARSLYSEALLLAGNAGDPARTAEILARLAGLLSGPESPGRTIGAARQALRLAEQAADEARYASSPWLHAQIACRRANATSLLGDGPEFQVAITRARREFDCGPRDGDREYARSIAESEITHVEALGYVTLGEPARAEKLYRCVLDGELSPVARAISGTQLAGALLEQGARDDAISAGMDVLDLLTSGVNSGRSLNQLRPVRAAAEQTKAEEFCARFDAVERALTAV